jgi:predicted transcriptional regulator
MSSLEPDQEDRRLPASPGQQDRQGFTPREEEVVATLACLGIKKSIAKTLVCLFSAKEVSSSDIEMITHLLHSEVSHALKYLIRQGWITCRACKTGSHGRPLRIFELSTPLSRIVDAIETEKMTGLDVTLKKIRAVREYTLTYEGLLKKPVCF